MSESPENTPGPGPEPLAAELALERQWLSASRHDPENFKFFYQKYALRIHRFIRARTGSEERARDLTAAVFTRALDNLSEFNWRGVPMGSWLFRIASNVIHDAYTRQSRRRAFGQPANGESLPDPKVGQLTRIIHGEDQQVLYECLHALPEQDQDIFILYYWEGLKTREVAVALDMSENTVKTRLKRGRVQLRTMMEARPDAPGQAATLDPDLRFAGWKPPPEPED